MPHPPMPEPVNVRSGYCIPAEDASTQTIDEDFILPGTTRDAITKNSEKDFGVREKIIYEGKNSAVTSENSKQNRKRNVSSHKMLTHDRDAHKRLRPEICGMSDPLVSIFHEQGGINPDSRTDIRATTSQIELDNRSLTDIHPEFRNIKESHSHNQSVQVLGYLENKKNFTGQNTASNMNISRNENAPDEVSDSERSKGKIAFSVDILAVPGPSRPHENIPQSNVCQNNPQNMSLLILQTVEEMKKTSTCLACEQKIAKHVNENEGKNPYKCCRCRYRSNEEDYLLMHICREHLSEPFFCNICKVRYAEVGSHESEHPCNLCEKSFQCITQLEDHYLIHEEHHSKFCRICESEIDKHATKRKGRDFYKCCRNCPHEFDNKKIFQNHLYTHSKFKLFKCDYCGERFTIKISLKSHSKTHPKCKICRKTFVDRNSLDAHCLEEHR